ncbi:MAG: hypothetical protein LAO09_12465 [Acidobacteriia bacterium]|nr:hypothetical protein [Terriglobia bacterium]
MLGRTLKIASLVMFLAVVAAAETIPAGTHMTARIDSQINSGTATAGQAFHGNLTRALVVNGETLAPSGAPVKGKVTYAKSSGRLHKPGELALRLTAVEINGKMVPISTSAFRAKGKSHTKSNVTKIGGGAAAGALIGGLAGGGKGALIGTAVGAGAGTGLAAATGKEEAVIHAESALSFTTTTTVNVK